MGPTLLGFRRPDGTWGIRNHVAILSVMDNVNPLARRVASVVRNTVAVCPGFGRAMIGPDYEQHVRTLVGLGTHPNVAAVVVLSLEPKAAERVAEPIAASGRRVAVLAVEEDGGTNRTACKAISVATDMVSVVSAMQREPFPFEELVVGVECGGSDSTSGLASNPVVGYVADRVLDMGGTVIMSEPVEWMGAEHLLAARAENHEVAEQIRRTVAFYEDYARNHGIDLLDSNPAPDNIAGGLSTIEEKSLGAILKGGKGRIRAVVRYAEKPPKRGLILMDAPSAGVENTTAIAAGGAHVILFSTGRGNPIGNPVAPTLKVTGNARTASLMADNIDLDVSTILSGGESIAEAGERAFTALLSVAGGALTRSEILGDTEISISRIGLSM